MHLLRSCDVVSCRYEVAQEEGRQIHISNERDGMTTWQRM